MPTAKELLLEHLEYTFEKEGWQPPLGMAVAGLTAEQAAWKPAPGRHSIWQILRHVLHWKRGVLDAWAGDPPDYQTMNDTDWPEVSGDQNAWEADVKALHDTYAESQQRLERLGDEDLEQTRPWYRDAPPRAVAQRLLHMFTHDIYHAGQIQYLRALQQIPSDRFFNAAGWRGDVKVLREVLDAHPDLLSAYDRTWMVSSPTGGVHGEYGGGPPAARTRRRRRRCLTQRTGGDRAQERGSGRSYEDR